MHIFISLWNRNLTGSTLTSPFGFFRHLQQEEILTKALFHRRMFSPEVKDDSQYEEALHTLSGHRWRGWARGLPPVEPHAAHKHTTSTPLPSCCRAALATASLVGFYSVLSFTTNQEPARKQSLSTWPLPRSFCQRHLRLSKHGCTTFYMTVKRFFSSTFSLFSFIYYSWTQIPNHQVSQDCCKLTSFSFVLPEQHVGPFPFPFPLVFHHHPNPPTPDISLCRQSTLWDLKWARGPVRWGCRAVRDRWGCRKCY